MESLNAYSAACSPACVVKGQVVPGCCQFYQGDIFCVEVFLAIRTASIFMETLETFENVQQQKRAVTIHDCSPLQVKHPSKSWTLSSNSLSHWPSHSRISANEHRSSKTPNMRERVYESSHPNIQRLRVGQHSLLNLSRCTYFW